MVAGTVCHDVGRAERNHGPGPPDVRTVPNQHNNTTQGDAMNDPKYNGQPRITQSDLDEHRGETLADYFAPLFDALDATDRQAAIVRAIRKFDDERVAVLGTLALSFINQVLLRNSARDGEGEQGE
jgi:hypothetical protein